MRGAGLKRYTPDPTQRGGTVVGLDGMHGLLKEYMKRATFSKAGIPGVLPDLKGAGIPGVAGVKRAIQRKAIADVKGAIKRGVKRKLAENPKTRSIVKRTLKEVNDIFGPLKTT